MPDLGVARILHGTEHSHTVNGIATSGDLVFLYIKLPLARATGTVHGHGGDPAHVRARLKRRHRKTGAMVKARCPLGAAPRVAAASQVLQQALQALPRC